MKDSKVTIDWLINRLIDGFIQSRRRADVQASLLSWPRIMDSISFVLACSFFFHSWQPNMIRLCLLKFWQTSNYFFCCVRSDGPTTKTNSSYKLAFDTFEKELCDVNYNLLINNSFTLDGLKKNEDLFNVSETFFI